MDEDVAQCSSTAAFAISIATVGYVGKDPFMQDAERHAGRVYPLLSRTVTQCREIRTKTAKEYRV
jgi:hypothetical protein